MLQGLYGLKQAGYEWSEELVKAFREMGFSHSELDQAIFFKRLDNNHDRDNKCLPPEHTVISVLVDDMAITLNVITYIKKFK